VDTGVLTGVFAGSAVEGDVPVVDRPHANIPRAIAIAGTNPLCKMRFMAFLPKMQRHGLIYCLLQQQAI
jgi:hypothetical protein